MKKQLLVSLFSFATFFAYAQAGELTNAILFLNDHQLPEAKASIDKVCVHEKTKDSPKAWLNRGKIYEAIAIDPTISKDNPEAAKIAFDAYQKAKQLDETAEKPGKFKKDIAQASTSQSLAVALQNGGLQAYHAKNLDLAYDCFVLYEEVKPLDTLGYLYAAQMALAKKDYGKAKVAYTKCIEKTAYVTPEILSNLLYIYKTVESERNYTSAYEIVKMGRAKYPTNQNFIVQEADLLDKMGKLPEAIASMESMIQNGKPTPNNYLILGTLYEKNNQLDKAKEAYKKAISLDPNNFEANYNLGASMYNPAAEINKQVRGMTVGEYNKKGKQMEAQAKELLKQALPYFEKANEVQPDDKGTKRTLREIYINLGETDKANSLK